MKLVPLSYPLRSLFVRLAPTLFSAFGIGPTVAVLGASNYTYAEATRSQQKADFVASTIRALEYVEGVPEIVVPGQTGLLIPFEAAGGGSPEPRNAAAFSLALAGAVNELMADPGRRAAMGRAARARVLAHFSWQAIADHAILTLGIGRDNAGTGLVYGGLAA